MKILTDRRYPFTTTVVREIGRNVKEKLCHIALRSRAKKKSFSLRRTDKNQTYMLSDGNISTVGTGVVPALFHRYTSQRNPRHFFPKRNVDIRKESYANVVQSKEDLS